MRSRGIAVRLLQRSKGDGNIDDLKPSFGHYLYRPSRTGIDSLDRLSGVHNLYWETGKKEPNAVRLGLTGLTAFAIIENFGSGIVADLNSVAVLWGPGGYSRIERYCGVKAAVLTTVELMHNERSSKITPQISLARGSLIRTEV